MQIPTFQCLRIAPGATLASIILVLTACATSGTEPTANVAAPSQSQTVAAAAQEAYAAEDWENVVKLYRQLTSTQPDNGRYWYRLAVGLRYTGKLELAHEALDEAAKVQVPPSYTEYERAKIAATRQDNAKAMAFLQVAADAGLAGSAMVLENEHLAALSGEPGFDDLVEQLETNQFPCRDSKYHEFDFWIGDWQVSTPNGQPAGTNKISAIEQDCLLLERWTSASGTTGTSINFYDLSKGRWVQQWVSSGSQIHIEGGLKDGSMVMEGFIVYMRNNNQAKFRAIWTPLEDGRVRQFFEQADAEGNWTPWFEGFYTRVADK
ncbi:MAG: hypothetical protein HKN70_13360 [Gammaproteobacteria bacterium]|nr:hypothetical protein [Gammaproteobacteria bacterium]